MENTLKLVGKNSNEIFTLRYPSTLVDFCEFDFSFFAQEAIEVCNAALKTGSPDFDKISEIKKDIQSAHCFMQYSTRTTYDKIVFDCWIDYVCRRDNIGNSALWNRFIRCRTPFEKIIFQRLCDFRYKRAVNEWLNVIRIQDYAKSKVKFVFPDGIKSVQEAEERKNYFDLMFSVTARELGCRLEDMGVTKYYSIGRIPGAPFLYPGISKEIVRHVLAGFDYSDDYSDINDYTESADEIAMDAFSRMKAGLPQDLSAYAIPTGKLENLNDRIYMPCGLKAAVDLEIDVMLESGMWLARCRNCGRYFGVSKDDYKEYCTRRNMPSGKTCLEIYEEQNPRPKMTDELEERCDMVTDEIYTQVGDTMSVEEFNSWRTYLEAMKDKVENGEILPSELENFLEYSLNVDISKSNPIVEVPKREAEPPRERVVKPFIPERISRSEIQKFEPVSEPEEIDIPLPKPSRDGFFTSPTVQRQKSERPQISHIIRNGESLGNNNAILSNSANNGFQPFEPQYQPENSENVQTSRIIRQSEVTAEKQYQPEQLSAMGQRVQGGYSEQPYSDVTAQPKTEREQAYENFRRLEERLEQERIQREQYEQRERFGQAEETVQTGQIGQIGQREERNSFRPLVEQGRSEFVEDYPKPPVANGRERNTVSADMSGDFRQYGGERNQEYERITPNPSSNSRIIRDYKAQPQTDDRPQTTDNRSRMEYAEQDRYQSAEFYNEPSAEQYAQPQQTAEQPVQTVQNVQNEQVVSEPEPKPRVIKKNAAAISAYGKMSGQSVTTVNPFDRTAASVQQNDSGSDHTFDVFSQPMPPEQPAQSAHPAPPPQIKAGTGRVQYSAQTEMNSNAQGNDENFYGLFDEDMLEPFKDIETIFDVLEQSETGMARGNSRSAYADYPDSQAQTAVPEQPKRVVPSRPLRSDEAPAGIWTEDRGLFRNEQISPQQEPVVNAQMSEIADMPVEEEKSELEMIREKRQHARSSKTQRLYDVIMREPDDNPNFRKKK